MFINPLGTYPISVSSPFGPRINPVTKQAQNHNGVDLRAPMGTPVFAMAAGTVDKVWTLDPTNGNAIRIDHGGGLASAYLHLSRMDVGQGAVVKAGQQIGAVGSTGRSTGPHLHLMVYKNNVAVDPWPLVAWSAVRAVAAAGARAGQTALTDVSKRWWAWSLLGGLGLLGALWALRRGAR